jgi:exopolysaccharide biosynthesis polyprenyl glycosylphosphotransferase
VSILEPTSEAGRLSKLAPPASVALPRPHVRRWLALAPLADALVLGLAVAVERLAGPAVGAEHLSAFWLIGFPAIAIALLAAGGLYRDRLRLQLLDDLRTIAGATAIASMATIAVPVLLGTSATGLPAQGVRLWLFATVYLTASRGGIISSVLASRRSGGTTPTLIVGAGSVGRLLAKRLNAHPEIGLRPVGFVDKDPLVPESAADEPTLPVLGASWDLPELIDRYEIGHVLITFSQAPHDVMLRVVDECTRRGVRVTVVPRLFERMPRQVTVDFLGGMPLVSIHPSSPYAWPYRVKYALDRVIATFVLLLLGPFLLVVALGVLVSTGRPILFRQARIGRDGRVFEMLKFRSMRDGEEPAQLAPPDGDLAPGGVEGDDRRTGFGSFIRRASIDELPQLFNVLRGDMSLVGPRPERPEFVDLFSPSVRRYSDRHRVKSGITGWAQINGLRGRTSLSDRVEWDNWYIENWSPWLDLKILLRTGVAVMRISSVE